MTSPSPRPGRLLASLAAAAVLGSAFTTATVAPAFASPTHKSDKDKPGKPETGKPDKPGKPGGPHKPGDDDVVDEGTDDPSDDTADDADDKPRGGKGGDKGKGGKDGQTVAVSKIQKKLHRDAEKFRDRVEDFLASKQLLRLGSETVDAFMAAAAADLEAHEGVVAGIDAATTKDELRSVAGELRAFKVQAFGAAVRQLAALDKLDDRAERLAQDQPDDATQAGLAELRAAADELRATIVESLSLTTTREDARALSDAVKELFAELERLADPDEETDEDSEDDGGTDEPGDDSSEDPEGDENPDTPTDDGTDDGTDGDGDDTVDGDTPVEDPADPGDDDLA